MLLLQQVLYWCCYYCSRLCCQVCWFGWLAATLVAVYNNLGAVWGLPEKFEGLIPVPSAPWMNIRKQVHNIVINCLVFSASLLHMHMHHTCRHRAEDMMLYCYRLFTNSYVLLQSSLQDNIFIISNLKSKYPVQQLDLRYATKCSAFEAINEKSFLHVNLIVKCIL